LKNAILLISCPDRKGITAAVTSFVFENGGNIIDANQHIDEQTNTFFMRIEWSLAGFKVPAGKIADTFKIVAKTFSMTWDLYFTAEVPRVAVFVSQHLHCLYDLLLRHRAGQFNCDIPLIISNHPQASDVAKEFAIKFIQTPVDAKNKKQQEEKQLSLLAREGIELVILARYHQILSPQFVARFQNKIINIHHSFLPAFVGKSPYDQAYQKGVKIIGATSHFVIPALDQGPIIDQDTVRISHRDSIEDLKRKGQDLEKIVLSRAVRWYLQRKILTYGNKTVVFD
jgi:formyltetrahydrofolate deformylase